MPGRRSRQTQSQATAAARAKAKGSVFHRRNCLPSSTAPTALHSFVLCASMHSIASSCSCFSPVETPGEGTSETQEAQKAQEAQNGREVPSEWQPHRQAGAARIAGKTREAGGSVGKRIGLGNSGAVHAPHPHTITALPVSCAQQLAQTADILVPRLTGG